MPAKTGYFLHERWDTRVSHRLLFDSGGRLWLFYQNQYRGLSCGFSDDLGNHWSESFDLMSNISGPFCAYHDEKDVIHLAIRCHHPQDIHYLTLDGRKGHHHKIHHTLENRTTTYCPLIKTDPNGWHLLYAARDYATGQWEMVHLHQKLGFEVETGGFALPDPCCGLSLINKELRFITDSLYWSGDLLIDKKGCLNLVYRFFRRDGYHLFYSSLAPAQSDWSPPQQLTTEEWSTGHPSLHAYRDGVYLLYRSSTNEEQRIMIKCLVNHQWNEVAAIPLDGDQECWSEGFLPGCDKPTPFWVNREGCWLLPFNSQQPIRIRRPEGKQIHTFSAVQKDNSLFLAWSEKNDPQREIYFGRIEDHL